MGLKLITQLITDDGTGNKQPHATLWAREGIHGVEVQLHGVEVQRGLLTIPIPIAALLSLIAEEIREQGKRKLESMDHAAILATLFIEKM